MIPAHAHEAVLDLATGADAAAPGAAVTVALCGHWRHDGSCRWPHHTSVISRTGSVVRLRVVFVAAPPEVTDVRARISAGLVQGVLTDEEGRLHRWRVTREDASEVLAGEELLARELSGRGAGS
ncbi:MAG: hypothetical protein WB493_04360 [Anaeromyxobacteraceae bacterium]